MRYFFDTEFIERGPSEPIRLLSIGIVAEDGREMYRQMHDAERLIKSDFARQGDRWLTDNVLPHIAQSGAYGATENEMQSAILAFVGDDKPEFWAYYADYDWVVLCQIFGRMIDLPKGWPMYCRDLKQLIDMASIDREDLPGNENEHHALADARWVAEAYRYVMEQTDGARLCPNPKARHFA